MLTYAETRSTEQVPVAASAATGRRRTAAGRGWTEAFVVSGRLRAWFVIVLWLLLITCALISVMAGRYSISLPEIIRALGDSLSGQEFTDDRVGSVLFGVRFPRTVLAIFVGAGLAVAGAAFQSVFSNPLATPDTLGVSAGTSVGAVLALIFSWNLLGVQALALLFGLLAMAVTVSIARHRGKTSIVMLVLAGVIVSAIANAVISMLKLMADPTSKLPEITYWLMGSLAGVSFSSIALGVPLIVLGTLGIYLLRWRLNVLALSEDEARAAGLNIRVLRPLVIACATLITASVVSMCGQVGWIGLLVPHCARMLVGNNNRLVIPVSLLLGAAMMLLIDTLARTMTASEIPISVLTALIGAPVFILLLRKTGGNW
ncbi:iron ABC transporter permease [Corynebacterium hylobatis]|uniref:Iron ABC transporter permease n=1 Tax=Corynebacterium hylobatis TaxID=1859290 RepID=A0A3R9ZEL9_9CORY|nr:iron ABC transporter permease [Corynebacterium hylobatis]RSZ63876.1 iron ABC transporter permease [Corynebacterium hylobatis]